MRMRLADASRRAVTEETGPRVRGRYVKGVGGMRADTRNAHSQQTGPRRGSGASESEASPPRRKSTGHGASVPKLRRTGLPRVNVDDSEARMEWISKALCR